MTKKQYLTSLATLLYGPDFENTKKGISANQVVRDIFHRIESDRSKILMLKAEVEVLRNRVSGVDEGCFVN